MTMDAPYTIRPLYSSPLGLSTLLTLDGLNILLDCGLSHSPSHLSTLASLAPTLSLVLLSQPTLVSLGLYPYLYKCGLRCHVYATLPTKEMGRSALEEATEWKEEEFGKRWIGDVSVQDVRSAISEVVEVKYGQPVHVGGGKGKPPVTLVAIPSGHALGGSIFTIRSPAEPSPSSSVVYAPFLNHIKERLLDASGLVVNGWIPDNVRRCGVFICAGERGGISNMRRKDRDRLFLESIDTTLQSHASVLIPIDPSARLLELLTLLEQHWAYRYGSAHAVPPLCLISKTGKDVLTYVRSLTAWMGGLVVTKEGQVGVGSGNDKGDVDGEEGGEEGADSVLRFKNLKHFLSLEALRAQIPDTTPKLILAVSPDLDWGPSRCVLADTPFGASSANLLLIPCLPSPSTLGRELFTYWDGNQTSGRRWGSGKGGRDVEMQLKVPLEMGRKVVLEGDELVKFLEEREREKEGRERERAREERRRRLLEAQEEGESEDEDDEDDEGEEGGFQSVGIGGSGRDGMIVDEEEEKVISFDIYVRADRQRRMELWKSAMELYEMGSKEAAQQMQRLANERFRMFPLVGQGVGGMGRRKVDTYGEMIDVEEWMRRGMDEEEGRRDESLKEREGKGKKKLDKQEEKREPPHKFVVENKKVELRCRVLAIDMEGKTDAAALKAIIPQISPNQLVLIHGDPNGIKDLEDAVKSSPMMRGEVFVGSEGVDLRVGEQRASFTIRLADSILGSAKLSKINDDYEIAHISGQITHSDFSSVPVLSQLSTSNHPSSVQSKIISPTTLNPTTSLFQTLLSRLPQHTDDGITYPDPSDPTLKMLPPLKRTTHFIGDMKLLDLKNKLANLKIPAEFSGDGTLMCGRGSGVVAVIKGQGGEMMIEGPVGEVYYLVRKEVYGLHARAG